MAETTLILIWSIFALTVMPVILCLCLIFGVVTFGAILCGIIEIIEYSTENDGDDTKCRILLGTVIFIIVLCFILLLAGIFV